MHLTGLRVSVLHIILLSNIVVSTSLSALIIFILITRATKCHLVIFHILKLNLSRISGI
jgi:hypothetical protein